MKIDSAQAFLDQMIAQRREGESRFVEEYMIDGNGTQAVLRANLAETSEAARRKAWTLLQKTDLREEIDRRIAERRATNKLTVAKIEGMLLDLAEVEPLDIWNEDGSMRPLQDMPVRARRAIKSIKRVEKEHPIFGLEVKVEIELWDKKGAIELLGKWKKMFTDKIQVDGELNTKVSFAINGIQK